MSKPDNKNEEIKQLVLTTDPENISEELSNQFAGIASLDLSYSSFKNIDILINFPNLSHLEISGCDALKNLDIICNLHNLTSLVLTECFELENIYKIGELTKLTSLDLFIF